MSEADVRTGERGQAREGNDLAASVAELSPGPGEERLWWLCWMMPNRAPTTLAREVAVTRTKEGAGRRGEVAIHAPCLCRTTDADASAHHVLQGV